MIINKEKYYKKLKKTIKRRVGKRNIYTKDCEVLSNLIFNETKRQISPSTLKRFFGLINYNYNPSRFTLDTLAIFCGFNNWINFVKHQSIKAKKGKQDISSWEKFKRKYKAISNFSIRSINKKVHKPFEINIKRQFIDEFITGFMKSEKTASALIAPGGYGKSSIALNIAKDYFFADNAPFANDILMLIDGSNTNFPYQLQFDFKSFLFELLGYNSKISIRRYFENRQNEIEGKFVLIIDGLNELTNTENSQAWFLEPLLRVIASNTKTRWFKIIITSRIYTWKTLANLSEKKYNLKNQWYKVSFSDNIADVINIPAYTDNEIDEFFLKSGINESHESVILNHPELVSIIIVPYFLNLYAILYKNNVKISEIDLFNAYISKYLLHGENSAAKRRIIDKLLIKSKYGRNGNRILKKDLNDILAVNLDSYNELLLSGLISEEKYTGKYLAIETYVMFTNQVVFEFFIAKGWVSDFKFNNELLINIIKYYKYSNDTCLNLIEWLIKYAFKESLFDLLKSIYKTLTLHYFNFLNEVDLNLTAIRIASVICLEIRKSEVARKQLLREYASYPVSRKLYFRLFPDIDFLVRYFGDALSFIIDESDDLNEKIYAYSLRLCQYTFEHNFDNAKYVYDLLNDCFEKNAISLYTFGYYLYACLLYEKQTHGHIAQSTKDELNCFIEKSKDNNCNTDILSIIIVSGALDLLGLSNLISKRLKDYANKFDSNSMLNPQLLQILMLLYASWLIDNKQYSLAREIYGQISLTNISANYKYIVTLHSYFIDFKFLLINHQIRKAFDLLNKIINIAEILGYKLFIKKAQEQIDILAAGNTLST